MFSVFVEFLTLYFVIQNQYVNGLFIILIVLMSFFSFHDSSNVSSYNVLSMLPLFWPCCVLIKATTAIHMHFCFHQLCDLCQFELNIDINSTPNG